MTLNQGEGPLEPTGRLETTGHRPANSFPQLPPYCTLYVLVLKDILVLAPHTWEYSYALKNKLAHWLRVKSRWHIDFSKEILIEEFPGSGLERRKCLGTVMSTFSSHQRWLNH